MSAPAPDPLQPGYTAQVHHRDRVAEHNQHIIAQAEVGTAAVARAERPPRSRTTRSARKAPRR
jgi:hypothetical protein